MYQIKIIYDIEKDAWNWRDACNKISHWVDRKTRIDPNVYTNIYGKDKDTAYSFLLPYLSNLYEENKSALDNTLLFSQEIINNKIQQACKIMEEVTWTIIYRDEFTWFITTFPRWPYSYQNGQIWFYYNWPIKNYLWLFLHELLHFQFIHYFKDKEPISNLNSKQFEVLKESLTVILNHEFLEFLWKPDQWYSIHQNIRVELDDFWKKNKNFNELIEYWCNIIIKWIIR